MSTNALPDGRSGGRPTDLPADLPAGRPADLPATRRPRVAIIGGGFAGLNAAQAFRRAPVDVLLIDRNNYHLFQPLLYQVATAVLSPEDIASPIRAVLRRQKNTRVILGEVRNIDRQARRLDLDNEEVYYDYLIVATGMETNYFGNNHWVPLAPGLKSLEDALECRRRILTAFEQAERTRDPEMIRRLLTFVVIGAGPTGVELAGAIREIGYQVMVKDFRNIDPAMARVILVDAGPRVLGGYDEKLSLKAKEALEEMGVEVRLDTMVKDIQDGGVQLGDEYVEACTIVWAAGVKATPLARALDTELDRAGRAIVTEHLTLPDDERVFVIGDLAHFQHGDLDAPLVGLAPVAIQQGRHAARNIVDQIRGLDMVPFHYRDKGTMATIGRHQAIAQIGRLKVSGYIAWFLWLVVHLMFLIGFRNRLMVILDWAYAYIGFRRSARLIYDVEHVEPDEAARPAEAAPPPPALPGRRGQRPREAQA